MRRVAQISLLLVTLFATVFTAACSDSGGKGDGSADGTGGDTSASCPAQQPRDGTACTGTASCEYGQSTCCGMTYSFMTCRCQLGAFSCAMTVECNIVCPDAGGSG